MGPNSRTLTRSDVASYAERAGLADSIDPAAFVDVFSKQDELLAELDSIDTPTPPERDYWPTDSETDPNAAFLERCDLQQQDDGPLSEVTLGIKDNIAVAGVPMTCGSPLLEQYVPKRDATVVQNLLDAGARILGKTNMDEFALGGGEQSMRFRLAQNPVKHGFQPGGSSAGSGIAVAEGTVDAALGSDTGGSVRFPASFCGVVGIKPTRGLVSHDGFVQFAKTVDTIGVLASETPVAAHTLETIAGPDPRDGATHGVHTDDYAAAVKNSEDTDVSSLTVGVPEELFGQSTEVDSAVNTALDKLETAGATIQSVSIPEFSYAIPGWLGIAMTEMGAYLSEHATHFWQCATPPTDLAEALATAIETDPDALGTPVVSAMLYGRHLAAAYDNRYYALGHIARRRVTAGVNDILSDVDVLAGPTTPMLPPEWGEGYLNDTGLFDAMRNTAPFNLTGHPAVSVPCGTADGLPVGLQFVAPAFREATALCAAAQWEALATE